METIITIPNNVETIDARIDLINEEHAVIIMHPHPLMGGDMNQMIVESTQKVFAAKKISTLRFNFRGVGRSSGTHDKGIGEQDDLIAVMHYLQSRGVSKIDIVGYSFGAWILALASSKISYNRGWLIAPPVCFLDFSSITEVPGLAHIIAGTADDFAPPKMIHSFLPKWKTKAKIHTIVGASHMFHENLDEFERVLKKTLRNKVIYLFG